MDETLPHLCETSWGEELRQYDEKRLACSDEFFQGRQEKFSHAHIKAREQVFNPLLQLYRDPNQEEESRMSEMARTLQSLNAARDKQLMEETTYNVVTNEERLPPGKDHLSTIPKDMAGLAGRKSRRPDKPRMTRGADAPPRFLNTFADFNIVTNRPHDEHNTSLAMTGCRPRPSDPIKEPRAKLIPPFNIRDFNIVNNKYYAHNEEKERMEKTISLLEATKKFRKTNRFDPLLGVFNERDEERRARRIEMEVTCSAPLRQAEGRPDFMLFRESEHYDMIGHRAFNLDLLADVDEALRARKARFSMRHNVDASRSATEGERTAKIEARQIHRASPERFKAQLDRYLYEILYPTSCTALIHLLHACLRAEVMTFLRMSPTWAGTVAA